MMPNLFVQSDANRALARQINQEARSDPDSPYAGKYVGIACGRVVVADPDLAIVVDALSKAEPDRSKRMFIEASADYDSAHEIWWA
jgi:hypothetical protein